VAIGPVAFDLYVTTAPPSSAVGPVATALHRFDAAPPASGTGAIQNGQIISAAQPNAVGPISAAGQVFSLAPPTQVIGSISSSAHAFSTQPPATSLGDVSTGLLVQTTPPLDAIGPVDFGLLFLAGNAPTSSIGPLSVGELETLMAGIASKQFGDGSFRRLAFVSGVDGLATGTPTLYTVPSGKTVVGFMVLVHVTAASGVTVAPSAGVGVAAGEDDIVASAVLTGLTSSGLGTLFPAKTAARVPVAGDVIKAGIDVGGTGTTLTLAYHVLGALV
jgi:hypothetical protein